MRTAYLNITEHLITPDGGALRQSKGCYDKVLEQIMLEQKIDRLVKVEKFKSPDVRCCSLLEQKSDKNYCAKPMLTFIRPDITHVLFDNNLKSKVQEKLCQIPLRHARTENFPSLSLNSNSFE